MVKRGDFAWLDTLANVSNHPGASTTPLLSSMVRAEASYVLSETQDTVTPASLAACHPSSSNAAAGSGAAPSKIEGLASALGAS